MNCAAIPTDSTTLEHTHQPVKETNEDRMPSTQENQNRRGAQVPLHATRMSMDHQASPKAAPEMPIFLKDNLVKNQGMDSYNPTTQQGSSTKKGTPLRSKPVSSETRSQLIQCLKTPPDCEHLNLRNLLNFINPHLPYTDAI
ncbi:MAG: hypothetical protein Q9170_006569 [Blastenia crenularia]